MLGPDPALRTLRYASVGRFLIVIWIMGAAILAIGIGVGIWTVNAPSGIVPAVLASPAPAVGVAPPAPDTTTGESLPRNP